MRARAWFVLAAVMVLGAAAAPAEDATLYRDTWGVPHIYAESDAAAAYALGYAQAEDRLPDLYQNILIATGGMCEHFGERHFQTDLAMKLANNAAVSQRAYGEMTGTIKTVVDHFIAGAQAYADAHPEKVPDYGFALEPWHAIAVGRAMILNWPLGTIFDDYSNKPSEPAFSSNQWAVAPSRSAEGCAIVLTDPHLSWEGLAVFYEARVHADTLKMNGFFILGTPVVGLGHSEHMGWAMTTGGPDTGDVYQLKVRKEGLVLQYEYEGQWETARLRPIKIAVKGEEKPRMIPAVETKLGVLLGEPDFEKGVAYAGKTPYLEDTGIIQQQYAMVTAKTANEFFQALEMNHLMEQNVMFADRQGNIGYVRAGITPIRPAGEWDWSKPVPGWTAETQWLGIHPVRDLVHIMNPPSGYMQNCNISPAGMWVDSTLTPDKYPSYVYNVSWDKTNARGDRARQLLAADDSITKEEAIAITMDVYDIIAEPWKQAVASAFAAHGEAGTPAAEAAADIAAWNGEFTKESTAATLMWRLRLMASGKIDTGAIVAKKALSDEDQKQLVALLGEAVAEIEKLYGNAKTPWGETHQVGRSGNFYGYDGADFGGGGTRTETLRDVEADEIERGSERYLANSGTMSAMLMFMHAEGIESYTCIPWGQSVYPDSPHHTDQSRELFSQRKMKPTWWKKEDLLANLRSEQTLQVP